MNNALIQLASIAACVSGDMHTMHLNYKGTDFDTMHKKVLQKYYEEAADDYDTWAEAAAMYGATLPNINNAVTQCGWVSFEGVCDRMKAITSVHSILETYVAALLLMFNKLNVETSAVAAGISNTLQTRLEYWTKELMYFNARRME